jgi:hypothetical protein
MEDYFFEYKRNFADKTIDEVVEIISKTKGLPLKDLKLENLLFYEGKHILTAHGVYIFRNDVRILYVGSCRAKSFVERIPAHLDINQNGWFNSFIRQLERNTSGTKLKEVTNLQLAHQAKVALETCSVILINFQWEDRSKEHIENDLIETFEKALLSTANPLNFSKRVFDNRGQKISEYITNAQKFRGAKK